MPRSLSINLYLHLSVKCPTCSFFETYVVAILLETNFCTFWRVKTLVLWRKNVQNLLIFVYLFCRKRTLLIIENLSNSGMVASRKLPHTSLTYIFNALSIGLRYTLSFQWINNFGLNPLFQGIYYQYLQKILPRSLRITENN